MKKSIKKILSILITLSLASSVLFVLPATAEAVDTPAELEGASVNFWADPENRIMQDDLTAFSSGDKTSMVGAVGTFKRSNSSDNYYLFLPSNADCNNLKVWFNVSKCTVNSSALESGAKTDVFADCDEGGVMHTYTLVLGRNSYTLNVMKSGDVGTVYIDTESGSISTINSSEHTTYESGTIMVVNPDGTIEYDGALDKMSGRGNGTWSAGNVKNPYNIKLASSTKLLGMPKAKKWCLLANKGDGSLVKNQITYDFADYIGVKYQPHCKPVDLYVNQQYYGSYNLAEKVEIKSNRINVVDNYENLEIANGTVDDNDVVIPADLDTLGLSTRTIDVNNSTVATAYMSDTSPSFFGHAVGSRRYSAYKTTNQLGVASYANINDPVDLTGGYIFELEISKRWATENAGLCGYNRQGWTVKSNDYISRHQIDYCYKLLYALGSAVYNSGVVPSSETTTKCSSFNVINERLYGSATVTNSAPDELYQGKKWSDILDSQSAVKYYWTQEFFKNMDSSTSSTYFYKDVDSKDGKLYAGPLWDMDNSFAYSGGNGSRWGYSWTSSSGWYTKNTRIYRWRANDSGTDYSTDNQSPLSFYGALATNCTDFWISAQSEWFRKVSPAVNVLTSDESEDNTKLHSVDYYVDTVAKSAAMNAYKINSAESDNAYNAESIKSQMKTWLAERQTWIDSQFSKVSVAGCTISSIEDQVYDGTDATPEFTVSYNGSVLIEGEDYTVDYSNNSGVGTATVSVTGKGMYYGRQSASFRIVKGELAGSVTIADAAYSGNLLTAEYKNANGVEIDKNITYQWYAGGVAISGATGREYTLTDSEKGKTVTVVITGDGTNFSGTLTSNNCAVRTGTMPDNYTETIAEWVYDYSVDPDAIVNTSTDGYTYSATNGQLADGAVLFGSVNASSQSKIKWSDDLYANSTTVISKDISPIMGTSKTDGVSWGRYPYFETVLSTKGYENVTFSAKLGGTKRGPSTWKLQYSLDGSTYTDINGATYVIAKNKTMEDAFVDVELPDACSNVKDVHIRAVVYDDVAIDSTYRVVGVTSGDASINNVYVKGTRITAITSLEAPTVINNTVNIDDTYLFDTDSVTLKDNNGGADVFYRIDGGDEIRYTGEFLPFEDGASLGDTATLTAYARFNDVVSDTVTVNYTFGGYDINRFAYSTYTENISGGALYSNGGAFDGSAKMTAYTDGKSQYVPLWNEKHGAFLLAPDDGALWSEESGYTFELSTSGFNDITLTAQAYTTEDGPKSLTMQFSLDGETWYDVQAHIQLNANGALEQYLLGFELPELCDNQKRLLVRLITTENATHGSSLSPSVALHNNLSKGNLYINNVVFSGNLTGEAMMPYTNKTSDFFGDTGSLKYYSADGKSMHYSVVDSSSTIILSGNYDSETGIVIPSSSKFNRYSDEAYTVSVWSGDNDDRSAVNTRKYYYKGSTITEFNYNSSTRILENYLSADLTTASNTSGVESTLNMYPNGKTATTLSSSDKYGVKVSWASDNFFNYNKKASLDTPDGNGCWLITTSTLGYKGITLNLEQLSSNKGPRDWGIAYSTDGTTFTYVNASNAHTISNDAANSTVETYNNFRLPAACDNQETLYIKVFINGGEAINGDELADITENGNTGIDNITISGVEFAPHVDVAINTVMLERAGDTSGTYPVDGTVVINGTEYETENGTATVSLVSGESVNAQVCANGTFVNNVTFTAAENAIVTVPVVAVDVNGDGYVNGRDLAKIKRYFSTEKRTKYKSAFANFIGAESSTFTYEK